MDETVPNPEELTPQPRDSPEPKSPKLSESQVDGMVEDKTEEDELEDEKPKTDEPTVIADAAAKDEDATKPSDSSPDPEDPSEADSKPPLSKASSAESAAGASASADTTDSNDIYQVKWIVFKNRKQVPIITQNANGPCPLLAIANVLLLQGKINLADGVEAISAEQLLGYLGEYMFNDSNQNISPERRLDYEANVSDAVERLPKLLTGIDVNVKFDGVKKFEYTSELIIFDLFNISLYHGWLVDPQFVEVVRAVVGLSYNQLVEKIIANTPSEDPEKSRESLLAQEFLEDSASQLTYHGLCEVNSAMKEDELAIFFRNNHFSTIYKRKNELFLLVTDQGFIKEPTVVWETLAGIDGACHFVDGEFITAPPKDSPKIPPKMSSDATTSGSDHAKAALTPEQQMEQDMQLAMSLEQTQQPKVDQDWEDIKKQLGDTSGLTDEQLAQRLHHMEQATADQQRVQSSGANLTDEELARQLQEEENQAAQQQQQQQPSQPQPRQGGATASPSRRAQAANPAANAGGSSSSQRTKNCVIL